MKKTTLALLIMSIVLLFCGCSRRRHIDISVPEPWAQDFTPASFGYLPARTPEHCHNALIKSYKQPSDRGRVQTIQLTNTMIKSWPNHHFLASASHLAGWAVLLADTVHLAAQVGDDNDSWERYVDSLLTASYYFEISAQEDGSTKGFWTYAAGAPLGLVHEGFDNVHAMGLYLTTQKKLKIDFLRSKDEKYLIDAVKIMESIEKGHRSWARQHGIIAEKEQALNAIAVLEKRKKESVEIFGD